MELNLIIIFILIFLTIKDYKILFLITSLIVFYIYSETLSNKISENISSNDLNNQSSNNSSINSSINSTPITIYYKNKTVKEKIERKLDLIKNIDVNLYNSVKNDVFFILNLLDKNRKIIYIKNDIDDILYLRQKLDDKLNSFDFKINNKQDVLDEVLRLLDDEIQKYKEYLPNMYKSFLSPLEGYSKNNMLYNTI